MNLGEIKIETLKLMFLNMNQDIIIEKLKTYSMDETYKSYLINMPGAINRCFSNIEEKRVLPSKTKQLNIANGTASGSFLRFDLGLLIGDFYDIERIVRETDDGDYNGNFEYQREGNTIVLEKCEAGDGITYTVIYKPRLTRVTSSTSDTDELGIPDNIASNIPYFLKGELYRDDEPNEASEARNWYEAAMEEIMMKADKQINNTNQIKNVYSQTE